MLMTQILLNLEDNYYLVSSNGEIAMAVEN